MQIVIRLNKVEVEFLSKYAAEFHEGMKIIRNKLEGPELDDPKYFELKSEIKKLNEKITKIQDFIDSKSGVY